MILAIDLGSSSFKAAVFDRRLRRVRAGSAPVRQRYASGGRVELAVTEAETALRRALPNLDGVTVIALASQAQAAARACWPAAESCVNTLSVYNRRRDFAPTQHPDHSRR